MIENKDGVLRITDGAQEVYNASTDQLFHFLPPRIDGSVTRESLRYSAGTNWNGRTADFSIGTLPSAATDIVGLIRITYHGGGQALLPNDAWYVAGGSLLLEFKSFQTISGTWGAHPSSIGIATIYNNGTDLRFREEIALKDHYMAGPGLGLASYTLTYRIYGAVFS